MVDFPQPDFADQGERLAAVQCEGNAIDRAHRAGRAAEQNAAPDREVARQVVDREDFLRSAVRHAFNPNSAAISAYDRRRASGSCTVVRMAISSIRCSSASARSFAPTTSGVP